MFLEDGLWLIDLDPRAEEVLIGPFDSVAAAHDARDYIWHYGEQYGRYIWCINSKNCDQLQKMLFGLDLSNEETLPNIEIEIDTLPLEIVGMRFMYREKFTKIHRVRRSQK